MNDSAPFAELAVRAARERGIEAMLPVVEKEILHYDILAALGASGWLERLVFQGGTCLRLCYGNARYSEDLDFTTPDVLTEIDLKGFSQALSSRLEAKYRMSVRVKDPASVKAFEGGGELKRWRVVVDTAPARPDLPSQKIKIEIASVPSYTTTPRLLSINYEELQAMFEPTVIACQQLEEILADKLISYANTPRYVRYRDLWDIPWILSRIDFDSKAMRALVTHKHEDYRCSVPLKDLLSAGAERALSQAQSEEYLKQMRRFIPTETFAATLGHPSYVVGAAMRISECYAEVLHNL